MEADGMAADKGSGVPVVGLDNCSYMLPHNQVMTEQQLETLRRQICVYSTICSQLVEMHKVMSQQASVSREHMLYDPVAVTPGFRPSARQRWTPSQTQLLILERLYECGNGTPNKQKIKEITSELSQHGQISETNVYNWFQNRKARAKRKQQLIPQKEGDSEVDTDGESSREKKPKAEAEFNQEDGDTGHAKEYVQTSETGYGMFQKQPTQEEAKPQAFGSSYGIVRMDLRQAEANAQSIERNHGVVKQKLRATDRQQFDDTQDNASSSFLLSEAEPETHTLFDRIGNAAVASAEHGIAQSKISVSAQHGSGTMTVLLDGKRWEVPTGVVDVRRTFGDNTILLDSRGHMVPTNDAGVTFHPLHASESYTLLRHGEMIGEASVKPSSGLLANSLHHIPGILNEVTEVCKEIDALDHVGHLQVLYIFFDLL
eukprot:Gb_29059 [translate_table: standard]